VIFGTVDGDPEVGVAGVVRGLLAEVPLLLAAMENFRPQVVGLGLAPEEAEELVTHFVGVESEPLVPLTSHEAAEVRGLARYGDVAVPHPALAQLVEWSRERSLPVEALDPTDSEYADLFADQIGYFELVRRTLRERKLSRQPPTPAGADEYVTEWERRLSPGSGSRRLAQGRDSRLANGVGLLRARYGRVAVVVDRPRFPSVLATLADSARAPSPGSTG
jgi:hypothetical protein